MALPDSWVDKIHARLLVRYGGAWRMMWEGIDMAAVREDWAEELAGFVSAPEALAWGLDHLPSDRPPTVQQFAAICNWLPTPAPLALEAPAADPARLAAVLQTLKRPDPRPAGEWADKLRQRDAALERLTPFQRAAWRDALRVIPVEESAGNFTPIPADGLPPAMRR